MVSRVCLIVFVLTAVIYASAEVYDNLDDAIDNELLQQTSQSDDYVDTSLSIMGESMVSVDDMYAFVLRNNPAFDREIASQYYEVGRLYNIRGDVALCQAIIETGWFKFGGGTAVRDNQYNFCGLGVTEKGRKGASFSSIREGVTAQIQHLFAYAADSQLPEGEVIVDPRFNYVRRASATRWRDLDMKWAMNRSYSESIIKLYRNMLDSRR